MQRAREIPEPLRHVLVECARQPIALDVIAAFLEDDELGTPAFWVLLEKMERRGLFAEGTRTAAEVHGV